MLACMCACACVRSLVDNNYRVTVAKLHLHVYMMSIDME